MFNTRRSHRSGKSFANAVSNVEVYGYIPRSLQVKNMLTAGKALDAFRSGLYMYNANAMNNFTADPDLLNVMSPVYNDKLSACERSAYLAGLHRGYSDFVASAKDPESAARAKRLHSVLYGDIKNV